MSVVLDPRTREHVDTCVCAPFRDVGTYVVRVHVHVSVDAGPGTHGQVSVNVPRPPRHGSPYVRIYDLNGRTRLHEGK